MQHTIYQGKKIPSDSQLARYLCEYYLEKEQQFFIQALKANWLQDKISQCLKRYQIEMFLQDPERLDSDERNHLRFCPICRKQAKILEELDLYFSLLATLHHLTNDQAREIVIKLFSQDRFFYQYLDQSYFQENQKPTTLPFPKVNNSIREAFFFYKNLSTKDFK